MRPISTVERDTRSQKITTNKPHSYDLRTSSPLARTTLKLGLNKIIFNPMEPMNFVVASEDHNLYSMCITRANTRCLGQLETLGLDQT